MTEQIIQYCKNGTYNELVQLLNNNTMINIHEYTFFTFITNHGWYDTIRVNYIELACINNHKDIVMFLINISQKYSGKKFDIHDANEFSFRWSCKKGYINIVLYLIKISKNYSGKEINININFSQALKWGAKHKKIKTLLNSIGCYNYKSPHIFL